jgi:cytochrome c oxidase subunit 3
MKKNFGMWIFLATEALIFGTFFVLFEIFFYKNYEAFKSASRDLHLALGTINTFILLTSSWFVARALEKKQRRDLIFAMILGLGFLGIKGYEYLSLTEEGKFPLHFEGIAQVDRLFLSFYGYLTFLHAIHLIIGIGLLGYVFMTFRKKSGSETVAENVGLYWHFVDIVWVFLYPIFYLAGNS